MELSEFVSKTLQQIVNGVNAARDEKGNKCINPSAQVDRGAKSRWGHTIHDIDFDVAVTVQDTLGSEGGAKISVMGMSVGGKVDSAALTQTVTRIKFVIPISFPEENNNASN
jgi:hypothetical protein